MSFLSKMCGYFPRGVTVWQCGCSAQSWQTVPQSHSHLFRAKKIVKQIHGTAKPIDETAVNRLSPNWSRCIEGSVRRWHQLAGGHLVPWYRGSAAQTRHMLTTQLDNFQHLSYWWHGALSHLLVASQEKRKWIFSAYPFLSCLSQLWNSTPKTSF